MRRTRLPAAQRGDAPPANVTPAVLADTYGIPGSVHKAGNTTYRQAVVELFSSHMNATDLSTFFDQYVPGAKAGDGKVFKFVGDAAEDGDQAEPNLDIQYIMGPAPGIATEFWAFAARTGEDLCSQIVNFTNTMLTGVDQPVVFSLSWGLPSPVPQDMCSASGVQVRRYQRWQSSRARPVAGARHRLWRPGHRPPLPGSGLCGLLLLHGSPPLAPRAS
jgi:hypothetical protein